MQPKAEQWKQQGLEIVVVTSDSKSEIDRFFAKNPLEATVLFDSQGNVGEMYEVYGIPASFLADRQGILRYPSVGWGGSGSMQKLQDEIDKILK